MNRRLSLFLLWSVQGLAALAWLALLPGDRDHEVLFGFSASRLALLGITLVLTLFSGSMAWHSRRVKSPVNPRIQTPLYLLSILVTLCAPAIYLVLRALGDTSGYVYSAYASRLAPLVFWFTLSGLEAIIFLAFTNQPTQAYQHADDAIHHILRFTLYAVLCLAAVAAFIVTSKLGISPSNDGSWGSPTTPLLEWQILLVLFITLAFVVMESRWKWMRDHHLFLLIYAFTCLLWLSQPIRPGFFATPPRAPNFEIYPFSDALIYAQSAQAALVGNGFMWPEVPTRPLYISFITWLHAIAGQDYTHVIALQTFVLALFPPVLYLLGKELAGRPLGLGLAVLAAFRDLTANIAAPFALNYTYTKLFFSEIPAALLICLFTLMTIRWMRRPLPWWYPLLAGGILGLSSLIRLQSAVVLAVFLPISFFVMKNRKKWWLGSVLMVIGVALALLPWLARNYKATGGIVLDNPISQTMVLARRWGGDNGNELIPRLAGEGDAQYSSRMSRLAFASLQANPGKIIRSAVNHFFNNEIGNLLVFPVRDQLNSPGELIWPQHAFWQTWTGKPTPSQIPIILFYLALLGIGLATACYKNGVIGLFPLAISVIYNAWTALFLSSGDRFLVPVDWAVYLYLFLGLFSLAALVLRSTTHFLEWIIARNIEAPGTSETVHTSWIKIAFTGAAILFIGASIPLTEIAFPQKYSSANIANLSPAGQINMHGRAIYPRWYKSGDGEPGSAKLGYGATDEARLVFFLVGEQNILVIFPRKSAPKFFPNASDVIVMGTLEAGFLQAQKITVQKDGKTVEYLP